MEMKAASARESHDIDLLLLNSTDSHEKKDSRRLGRDREYEEKKEEERLAEDVSYIQSTTDLVRWSLLTWETALAPY